MLLVKDFFDYFGPVFNRHVLLFLAVEPPIAVRTVKIADVVDIYRTIHRLLDVEKLVCGHFLKDANIKWHLAQKLSYATAKDYVNHISNRDVSQLLKHEG